jgi:hypothetical protein
VCRLADEHGVSHDVAAGVVAALSPNTTWASNQGDARALLQAHERGRAYDNETAEYAALTVSTYGANKLKAWSIVDERSAAGILSGPKVTAFHANLLGRSDVVTLDSHAFNAWKGYRATGSKLPRIRVTEERQARADYLRAARVKGETACAFQAILWVVWRDRITEGKVEGYA